jgi:prepilin-type N-terminal cleavage/methylation domain-containing protein
MKKGIKCIKSIKGEIAPLDTCGTSQTPDTLNSGFTIIEILVASALLVVLSVAFVGLQYVLSQNQTSAWQSYQSIENANGVVNIISKELRNAQKSETGSYPLVTANDQSIVFYSDYDYDGISERVRYTLTGSQLVRGIVEPTGSPYSYNLASEKVKNSN